MASLGFVLAGLGTAGIVWPVTWLQHAEARGTVSIRRVVRSECDAVPAGAIGVLAIPSVGVVAPVAQGLAQATLAWAVGHDPSTPLPGELGVSVLAAHDVSYFASNATLRRGAAVLYAQGCRTYVFTVADRLVLHPGQLIPPPGPRGLALDSCWPSDALFLTPDRLIVTARLVAITRGDRLTLASTGVTPSLPAGVPQPPNLFASGWLGGTLTILGAASVRWRDSRAPMAWEAEALASLSAARVGLAQDARWTSLVVAAGTVRTGLLLAPYTSGTPVSVREVVLGDRVLSVAVTVTLGGNPLTVTEVPSAGTLRIVSVDPV
ncbi:peptidase C60 sortase A and B [Acidimicrobium ferrooxidans DSM 10331]|uniref:Peptidase C60 sortase A and B n=1 Tax=Acidimicrobium ferrooxidans (strain DSM 10331 / JCM 15462 / NBRC 103882 / ICP) TaxID=525909 RepID=C7M1J5_ACIFD|nr:peptidase C60 sortase A and B [Acidimicrobium ferrooxidans DSM 10331]